MDGVFRCSTASRPAVSRASTSTTASVRRSTCCRAAPSRRARSVSLSVGRWRGSGSQLLLGWALSCCDGRFAVVAGLLAQSRGQHLEVPRYRGDASPRGEGRRGGATCPPCLSRPYSLPRVTPPPTHTSTCHRCLPRVSRSFLTRRRLRWIDKPARSSPFRRASRSSSRTWMSLLSCTMLSFAAAAVVGIELLM